MFMPTARNLLNNSAGLGIRASQRTNYRWNTEYCESTSRLRAFIPIIRPVGLSLFKPLGSGSIACGLASVGRFHSSMHKWDLAPSANCECGASEQTADQVLITCFINRAPHGALGIMVLNDETQC